MISRECPFLPQHDYHTTGADEGCASVTKSWIPVLLYKFGASIECHWPEAPECVRGQCCSKEAQEQGYSPKLRTDEVFATAGCLNIRKV